MLLLELIAMDLEAMAARMRRVNKFVFYNPSSAEEDADMLERLATEVRGLMGSPLDTVIHSIFEDLFHADAMEKAIDLENDYFDAVGFSHFPSSGMEYVQKVIQIYKDVLKGTELAEPDEPIAEVHIGNSQSFSASNPVPNSRTDRNIMEVTVQRQSCPSRWLSMIREGKL
jgi:SAM-dependent methyltransferase